jgi:hypothetical protein
MPKSRTAYGWKDAAGYHLSLLPRDASGASNVYASPREALADAHARGMRIIWENPAEIDGHQYQ